MDKATRHKIRRQLINQSKKSKAQKQEIRKQREEIAKVTADGSAFTCPASQFFPENMKHFEENGFIVNVTIRKKETNFYPFSGCRW